MTSLRGQTNFSAMLPAFLTTVLFAISAVSANRTTKLLGGIEANFWRITAATLFLAFWAHSFGEGLSGAAFPVFLLSGCVGFGVGDTALYQALPRLGSRLSVLIVHCLAAPFAGLTEWLWLGTTLSGKQILFSLTILAGVSLALAPSKHLNLSRRVLTIGVLLGVIAAFGQGFGAVLSRKAYQVAAGAGENIDGMTAAYQRILAGWCVAAVLLVAARRTGWRRAVVDGGNGSLAAEQPTPAPLPGGEPATAFCGEAPLRGRGAGVGLGSGSVLKWNSALSAMPARDRWRSTWSWILINALAGPTLGVSCYQWALATTPTGIVLPIVAITPLVVIPFARVMEGEQPTPRSLAGGVIAVIGAAALAVVK